MLLRKEAVAVCGERLAAGITMWDVETGEVLLRIPTSASPPHGLICIRDTLLVASQIQHHRAFAGGAIFFWHFDKPQAPVLNYTVEAIGPIACSKDGVYLVGGAPSGNAYIWEVISGRLLKTWQTNQTSLRCLAVSPDGSLLISGSEDGLNCVWSMISLLDVADPQVCGSLSPLQIWSDHRSSITSLLLVSAVPTPVLISSSLDGTCKVKEVVSGRLLQSCNFSVGITAVTTNPGDKFLFAGGEDGIIYVNLLHVGIMQDESSIASDDESGVLCGHRGPITALTFNSTGSQLISASKDSCVCLWDVKIWQIIRRFDSGKGSITNLSVISLSSSLSRSGKPRISLLEKAPQMNHATERIITLLPSYCSLEDKIAINSFRSSTLLNQQILDLEGERTTDAVQMKLEICVETRLMTVEMTKTIVMITKHLQLQLMDMIQQRLSSGGAEFSDAAKSDLSKGQREPLP